MKKIKSLIPDLDNNEKDFLLLGLAFALAAVFFIVTGSFSAKVSSEPTVFVGYKETSLEDMQLNELQISACKYASTYDTCDRLDDTFIITSEICCKKRSECCSDG